MTFPIAGVPAAGAMAQLGGPAAGRPGMAPEAAPVEA